MKMLNANCNLDMSPSSPSFLAYPT